MTKGVCLVCGSRDFQAIFTTLYRCAACTNGFIDPVPRDLGKYYPNTYWASPGILGALKRTVFGIFQTRRVRWITNLRSGGSVLDVGSGTGEFGKHLPVSFEVTNFETTSAAILDMHTIKGNIATWKTKKQFDCIVLWESLEHMENPAVILRRLYKLVKPGGIIFIEYPRWNCLESKIFGRHWFHLDIPRHVTQFTDDGIRYLFEKNGFAVVDQRNVLALEYAPWGLAASIVAGGGTRWGNGSAMRIVLLLLLTIIAIPFELVFSTIGQSPIGLLVARKPITAL